MSALTLPLQAGGFDLASSLATAVVSGLVTGGVVVWGLTQRLDERTNSIQQRIGRLENRVGGVEDQLTEIAIELGVQRRLREREDDGDAGDGGGDEAPTTAADGGSEGDV